MRFTFACDSPSLGRVRFLFLLLLDGQPGEGLDNPKDKLDNQKDKLDNISRSFSDENAG